MLKRAQIALKIIGLAYDFGREFEKFNEDNNIDPNEEAKLEEDGKKLVSAIKDLFKKAA